MLTPKVEVGLLLFFLRCFIFEEFLWNDVGIFSRESKITLYVIRFIPFSIKLPLEKIVYIGKYCRRTIAYNVRTISVVFECRKAQGNIAVR